MRWFIAALSLITCLMPWRAGFGQELSPDALAAALTARTPGATLERLQGNPQAFIEEAAGLILGYGQGGALTADQIETAIAAELSRLRARELRRLLEADLDNDLNVTRAERDVQIAAASATMRGRLLIWHRAADANRDGTATWAEMRAHAQARSEAGLSARARAGMRAMLVFDLDGDGRVVLDEVLEAVDALDGGV
ncbi:hypothetical protein [uncultured Tateyamaria sp.]|uniref:hypothetical protein n=1 Tax=Tateyamaria sp. 1078 TaxID=3417464 RepID=UPI0026277DBC|nr:hypothetical protein [uncultured Tateyamaria sp.]